MSATSDPVVRALSSALQAGDSIDLRTALGERLITIGEPKEALVHFEAALQLSAAAIAAQTRVMQQAQVPVLIAAARAAEALGDSVRANAYRFAVTALSAPSTVPAPASPTLPIGEAVHLAPAPVIPLAVAAPPHAAAPSAKPVHVVEADDDGVLALDDDEATSEKDLKSDEDAPEEEEEEESEDGADEEEPLDADDHLAAGAEKSPPPDRHGLRLVDPGEVQEVPAVTFADIGGMDEVKQRLTRSFLLPLRNPELVRRFGKSVGGGLLLYGPPGCGKTFLARAVAGEVGARFFNVGLSDVLDMWFGESERKLHELFENARRMRPSLIFLDEVDAIGQRRSQLKGSAGRNLVNQLLSEMDGIAGDNEGVFFLAATNHPWDVDPALRRPGRFDRLVFVTPPDEAAREAIFKLKLKERPVAANVDPRALAKQAQGFSGADIDGAVRAGTELALEESVTRGEAVDVTTAMLKRAIADARPSTRPWFELARNHAIYANEGGVYDELLAHLKTIGLG